MKSIKNVVIHSCQESELPLLEWDGKFMHHRQIFEETFKRKLSGEVEMLNVLADDHIAGQVWIDFSKKRDEGMAILWALRVKPSFQRQGMGTFLIAEAERVIRGRGVERVEICVEKNNSDVKRLYERLGYQVEGDDIEEVNYKTPDGEQKVDVFDEWLMRKSLSK